MKLPKSAQIKETVAMFAGKYNYKIVLVCPVASWFRGKKYDYARRLISARHPMSSRCHMIRKGDTIVNYCHLLLDTLEQFNSGEYDLRISNPLLNFYTNNTDYIEQLAAIDERYIKFISLPSKNIQKLIPGQTIVKTLDYDYKVFLSTIKNRDHSSFLNWAKDNPKLRVTNRCIKDLTLKVSWGGSYFYVKDEKTLTMVKMFLGSDISKINRVIKG